MKTFVVGGYVPRGGGFMAYNVGRVLHERFGSEVIIVRHSGASDRQALFEYEYDFETCELTDLAHLVSPHDLLISNPSFSALRLGFTLPCKKLMYVQGINTYEVLDGAFDHYVSVSQPVQSFLRLVYRMETPVIPAFVDAARVPDTADWWQRDSRSLLVFGKTFNDVLLERVKGALAQRYAHLPVNFETPQGLRPTPTVIDRVPKRIRKALGRQRHVTPFAQTQAAHFAQLGRYRTVLTLSAVEGFGLVPLEAMACGCAVVGFDGFGGLDYMKPGENCETVTYPDIDLLVDKIAALSSEPERAHAIAQAGRHTALSYSREIFDHNWSSYLSEQVL